MSVYEVASFGLSFSISSGALRRGHEFLLCLSFPFRALCGSLPVENCRGKEPRCEKDGQVEEAQKTKQQKGAY